MLFNFRCSFILVQDLGLRVKARITNPPAGLLYAADMFFNFHCSFIAVHRFKRCTVADGRLVAWFYIRHGSFLVDLLSVAPTLELMARTCAWLRRGGTQTA